MLSSRSVKWVLFLGALIPLAVSLLLGRVYCGWICPVGLLLPLVRRVRAVLAFLELKLPAISFDRRVKYGILAAGSFSAFILGLPVLHNVYPPALLGREAHGLIAGLFDGAEAGRFGFHLAGLTGASLFLLAIAAFELFAAPGFWCRSVCPGGALYSLLGRFRLLRVRRIAPACTDCARCDQACPMGLAPMSDRTGGECDNCGVCIDVCPTRALTYSLSRTDHAASVWDLKTGGRKSPVLAKMLSLAALMTLLARAACAHHIMGIPHYSYDENYPQAPVMKLVETVGSREMQLTAYPGNPVPGNPTEVHAYIYVKADRSVYSGPLSLEVHRVNAFGGRKLVHGPEVGRFDGNLFKFYPTYPVEGNYELTLKIDDADAAEGFSTLRVALVVGKPGSPWAALGIFFAGLAAFVVVVRAVKIKRERRKRARAAVS